MGDQALRHTLADFAKLGPKRCNTLHSNQGLVWLLAAEGTSQMFASGAEVGPQSTHCSVHYQYRLPSLRLPWHFLSLMGGEKKKRPSANEKSSARQHIYTS